ncbi:unnamed protein product [Oppiella nova]|uniref:Porin n=1 Tax=Oppiella nova TaxID=334625 RepID=A0A7R9LZZ7_9ACAR|nr:unnamed protein product [Oppiella nova]CAG2168346.1 unnamed protein product [Oppiella nova]
MGANASLCSTRSLQKRYGRRSVVVCQLDMYIIMQIHVITTVNDLAPGLKAIIKGTIPDTQSGKVSSLSCGCVLLQVQTCFVRFKKQGTSVECWFCLNARVLSLYGTSGGGITLPPTDGVRNPGHEQQIFDVEYVHGIMGLKGCIGLKQSPVAEGSIAFGKEGVLIGGEGAYDTNKGEVTKYSAGIQYSQRDFSAAAILADRGNKLIASYYHSVNLDTAVGVEATHKFDDNANTFTAGTKYHLDPLTFTKVRLDNHGKLAGLLQHEFRPKNTFTVSSEVDTKALDKSAKVGLALNIVP